MSAYAELQECEFAAEGYGYTATRHQREVGTGYFDEVNLVISCPTVAAHGHLAARVGQTQFQMLPRY